MNLIKTIFKNPEKHTTQERRIKVMQSIVMALHVPLSHPDTYKIDKTPDFNNEEWLIDQLSRAPKLIAEMRDNSLNAEIDAYEYNRLRKERSELHSLKTAVCDKDKEIETLKALLEWSKEDEQEWEKHKEIFNFMVKKYKHAEAKMKAMTGGENKWI